MQQTIKNLLLIAGLLVLGLTSAHAFSLGGLVGNGGDNWQVSSLGYGPPTITIEMAPKNIGEGYRRNIPVMYYVYSPAFDAYFGTAGETNIDAAFGLLNNALTNQVVVNGHTLSGVASYSSELGEWPVNSSQINYTAQALGLLDLKSAMMAIMMPQLGLDYPEENTWRLFGRFLPTGGVCPADEYYYVVQRNYASSPSLFNQSPYSPYVNNTLYSFFIQEFCTAPAGAYYVADTVVTPVDDLAQSFTAVAGGESDLNYGVFYTGLTVDDVAGLRYLLNTNNVITETIGGGSLLFDNSTNSSGGETLFPTNNAIATGYGTYNYSSLLSFATTNAPAVVEAAFPGVLVGASTNYFVLASNVTVTAYYTNFIGSAYGSLPVLVVVTNYTPYLQERYEMSFLNVVPVKTNEYTTNILMTVTTGPLIGGAVGNPDVTTTNYQKFVLHIPSGDYYTVPLIGTNECGSGIIYTGLTTMVYTTNLIASAYTNLVTTNSQIYTYSESVISSYASHTFVAYPVNCAQTAGATGKYQGINQLQFVRADSQDYDPLLNQFFNPFTNSFTKIAVTNGQMRVEHFDRVVTAPDVVVGAETIPLGPAPGNIVYEDFRTTPVWDTVDVPATAAGPGTIDPPTAIEFNEVGNIYDNGSLNAYYGGTNGFLLGQNTQPRASLIAFASFDGSTNLPTIYPNGSSIVNLQNQLLVQVTPTAVANGTNGVAYPAVQFAASGGPFVAPFSWSTTGLYATGQPSTGLPPGMTLSSGGVLSGTPTLSGTYDFTLILTDSLSNTVQWNYTIIIQ